MPIQIHFEHKGFDATSAAREAEIAQSKAVPLPQTQILRSFAIQALVGEALRIWPEEWGLTNPGLLIIANNGPNPIYYGGEGVRATDGIPVQAGGKEYLDNILSKSGSFWIIGSVADQVSPADTRILIAGNNI